MSDWTHFIDIAQALRDGELSPQQALGWQLPCSLLHHYACDCAEQALTFLQAELGVPHRDFFHSLEVKRGWVEGVVTERELEQALATVERLTPTRYAPNDPNVELDRFSAFVVTEALSHEPTRSIVEILRCTSDCLSRYAKDTISWELQTDKQMLWERLHLSQLLLSFVAARRQLLSVFLQRKTQLTGTLGSLQMMFEDVLY